MDYFEKLFDDLTNPDNSNNTNIYSNNIIYFNFNSNNNSYITDEIKNKYRIWLKTLPIVNRAMPADISEGGNMYTVVELNLVS